MAECVVDRLEVVDIRHDEAKGLSPLAVGDCLIHLAVESRTVGNAGQPVGPGLFPAAAQAFFYLGNFVRRCSDPLRQQRILSRHLLQLIEEPLHGIVRRDSAVAVGQVYVQRVEICRMTLGGPACIGHVAKKASGGRFHLLHCPVQVFGIDGLSDVPTVEF